MRLAPPPRLPPANAAQTASRAIVFPISLLIHATSERVASMSTVAPNSIISPATPVGSGEATSF